MVQGLAAATRRARSAAAAVRGPRGIGCTELLLAGGLAGLAVGSAQVWPPLGWLVPSAIVTWIALPTRTPFITRPPADTDPARRVR
jgi:hypothetical protein